MMVNNFLRSQEVRILDTIFHPIHMQVLSFVSHYQPDAISTLTFHCMLAVPTEVNGCFNVSNANWLLVPCPQRLIYFICPSLHDMTSKWVSVTAGDGHRFIYSHTLENVAYTGGFFK